MEYNERIAAQLIGSEAREGLRGQRSALRENICMGMCLFAWKLGLFLSVYVNDVKTVGMKQKMNSMWKILAKWIRFWSSNAIIGSIVFGMHAKRSNSCSPSVQSQTDLYKKLTTTREADEKHQTKETYSLEKNIVWS